MDGTTVGVGSELGVMSDELGVMPNPSSGVFTISTRGTKIKEIKVMNVLGEVVKEMKVNNETIEVDLSNYGKGIYFIEVKSEKGIQRKKFVKE